MARALSVSIATAAILLFGSACTGPESEPHDIVRDGKHAEFPGGRKSSELLGGHKQVSDLLWKFTLTWSPKTPAKAARSQPSGSSDPVLIKVTGGVEWHHVGGCLADAGSVVDAFAALYVGTKRRRAGGEETVLVAVTLEGSPPEPGRRLVVKILGAQPGKKGNALRWSVGAVTVRTEKKLRVEVRRRMRNGAAIVLEPDAATTSSDLTRTLEVLLSR